MSEEDIRLNYVSSIPAIATFVILSLLFSLYVLCEYLDGKDYRTSVLLLLLSLASLAFFAHRLRKYGNLIKVIESSEVKFGI